MSLGLGLGLAISGGGAAPASPLVIFGASLVLDLDSRFVTQAAGACSAMQDQSGAGNDCTQATPGSRPGVATGVNGIQKLTLSGTQFLTGSSTLIAAGQPRTVYAVVNIGSNPSSVAALLTNCLAAPYSSFQQSPPAASGHVWSDGVVRNIGIVGTLTSGLHLMCWKITYGSTTGFQFFIDGAQVGTNQTTTTATSDTGTAGYNAFSNSNAQGWIGDGYRLIQVAGISTGPQDTSVHSIMSALYGTP